MVSHQRQKQIFEFIRRKKSAQIKELSDAFGISLWTVRRDLEEMEQNGLIQRVRGGALLVEDAQESPLEQRSGLQTEQKQRIGAAAADLVQDGDTIIIATGTTTAEMIPFLGKKSNLTVITNAVNHAYRLSLYPTIEVIVLGGWLRHSEFSLLGHLTVQALNGLLAKQTFHGTFGIDADGLTGTYIQEVQTDRELIATGKQLVVLADSTKFKQTGSVRLVPLETVSTVITGVETEEVYLKPLRKLGIKIIQV
jgi:DeoR/GlpR family transcriptional regulator of sugar metabolism